MHKIFIGIVTVNRTKSICDLLQSIIETGSKLPDSRLVIVDANKEKLDLHSYDSIIDEHHLNDTGHCSVVDNKNIILSKFMENNDYEYLFILEDDIKIIKQGVFERYVEMSKKYDIPHMNKSVHALNKTIKLNNDLKVTLNLGGVFQFFTKECVKLVGPMNSKLCHNCWEHVEYTYRIHQRYGFNPVFYMFPDVFDSDDYVILNEIEQSTNKPNDKQMIEDMKLMLRELGIEKMPMLNLASITSITWKNFKIR